MAVRKRFSQQSSPDQKKGGKGRDDKQNQKSKHVVMPEEEIVNLKTVQFDARFPNQNQTRNCWQNYVDYHRCHKVKGDDHEPCDYFKRIYRSICPNAWVEKWDTQMDEGIFAAKI